MHSWYFNPLQKKSLDKEQENEEESASDIWSRGISFDCNPTKKIWTSQ